MRVAGRPENPVEFDIGIHPDGHASKQFDDHLLAEHHAGIALIDGDYAGGRIRG